MDNSQIEANYKDLSLGVIENAAKDAAKGDPTAAAWLLTPSAGMFAEIAGIQEGFLGQLANDALERLQHGKR